MRNLFRPAPPRQPGRHSAEWAAMQQALVELQRRANGFEQERDAVREDLELEHQRHARERVGWQDALRLAGEESMDIARDLELAEAERDRLAEEVKDLRRLLSASTGEHGYTVPAPIDQGCRDTPHAAEATVQATLADLEATGEHALLDLLSGLREDRGPKPPLRTDPVPVTAGVAAVLPLYDATLPVRPVKPVPPTEASPMSGQRAQAAVADVVGATP